MCRYNFHLQAKHPIDFQRVNVKLIRNIKQLPLTSNRGTQEVEKMKQKAEVNYVEITVITISLSRRQPSCESDTSGVTFHTPATLSIYF